MAMRLGLCKCQRPSLLLSPTITRPSLLSLRHRRLHVLPPLRTTPPTPTKDEPKKPLLDRLADAREDIYTLPNLLTLSRILLCPILAHSILTSRPLLASSILFYCAVSDLADGELARRYGMKSVLGTILDPAADKILMTTMVVSLGYKGLLPRQSPLSTHPTLD